MQLDERFQIAHNPKALTLEDQYFHLLGQLLTSTEGTLYYFRILYLFQSYVIGEL